MRQQIQRVSDHSLLNGGSDTNEIQNIYETELAEVGYLEKSNQCIFG